MQEVDPVGADSLLGSCSGGEMEERESWRDGGRCWVGDGERGLTACGMVGDGERSREWGHGMGVGLVVW